MAYENEWAEYRRRQRRLVWLAVLIVPCVGGPTLLCTEFGIPYGALLAWAFVWMIAIAVVMGRAAEWLCPRCGRTYFRNGPFQNSFARECLHCGLPKWSSGDSTGARP